MNTLAFGNPAWTFLHAFPYTYPHEILDHSDTSDVVEFVDILTKILPCIYCRKSAAGFVKDVDIQHTLFITLPDGTKLVTRFTIFGVFFRFHNLVDQKLGYPIVEDITIARKLNLISNEELIKNLISFLMFVILNYPENDPDENIKYQYKRLFRVSLPRILKYVLPAWRKLQFPSQVFENRKLLKEFFKENLTKVFPEISHLIKVQERLTESFRARDSSCKLQNINEIKQVKKSCI